VGSTPEPERRARFELLAGEVYEPVQRFLLRRCDPATADDVLGDTLLVVWRRLDDVPADGALPWVYGVARGCLANARRSAARQQRLVLRLAREPAQPPDVDVDPDLAEALAALPDADRELLRLWAWEQLAPREIAVALGIGANAATIRLHRAKKRLRAELTGRKDRGPAGHEGVAKGGRAR
jgi:RNA polymerase sigma-70 factor, ECF subfamily